MPLADSLSSKLNAQSLVSGLGDSLTGPAASLAGVSVPIDTGALSDATAGTSSLSMSSIGDAVQQLAALAGPVLQALPITGDLMRPITDIVALVEKATETDLAASIAGLREKMTAALAGDDVLGGLARAAQALAGAPEGQVLQDLLKAVAAVARIPVPALPFGAGLQAAQNAVAVIGSAMALDSLLGDAAQAATFAAGQVDTAALSTALAGVTAALGSGGTSLAVRVAATDATDAAQVASALSSASAVAAQLADVKARLAAGIAFGQAGLAQLDLDRLPQKIAILSGLLRSTDLGGLQRLLVAAASGLAGFQSFDPARAAIHTVDAAVTAATARFQQLADQIAALDVNAAVAPVTGVVDGMTAIIGRIGDAITQVTMAFQGAMDTVRNAIAALPVQAIVDAIQKFLAPITDMLAKIEQIIDQVHAALQTAADAAQATIGQVDGLLDGFKNDVDTLFGGARDFVATLNLDAVVGQINDAVRAFSDVLAKAQLKPYFDTADSAIGTAADVISKIPFGMLPDSMKQQVTDALEPIKDADASAVQTEIEGLLDMQPAPDDPNDRVFAVRGVVDDAIKGLQQKYEQLIAAIQAHDPRQYLQALDDKLAQVSAAMAVWSPALTLQPLTDAVNEVKTAIAGFDLQAQLQPVHQAFTQIQAAIAAVDPTKLVQPVEERIQAARTKLYQLIAIDAWQPAVDGFVADSNAALAALDPARVAPQLQAAIEGAIDSLGSATAGPVGQLGALLAPLTSALGVPDDQASFGAAAAWLSGGDDGVAALTGRATELSNALAGAARDMTAFDVAALATPLVPELAELATAVSGLAEKLPPASGPALALAALVPRLRGDLIFGSLATARDAYLAALSHAADAAAAVAREGFSAIRDAAQAWQAAVAPLRATRDFVAQMVAALGVTSAGGGLAGLLRALLASVPPERIAGIFTPLFDATAGRIQGAVTAVQTSVDAGIGKLKGTIDAIDLKPLTDAVESVFGEVESQIAELDPNTLLAAPLAAFKKLQDQLATEDPMAQVLQIITDLRDAAAALLAKLDANKLLATPLAIYDDIMAQLSKLEIEGLLDPVFNQMDAIAEQAHQGLTDTVAAFVRLQAALPGAPAST
jgi:hypothetical protein